MDRWTADSQGMGNTRVEELAKTLTFLGSIMDVRAYAECNCLPSVRKLLHKTRGPALANTSQSYEPSGPRSTRNLVIRVLELGKFALRKSLRYWDCRNGVGPSGDPVR